MLQTFVYNTIMYALTLFNYKKYGYGYCQFANNAYLCTQKTSRGGAVVARWAHNPKVVGSSPAPATKK